MARPEILDWVEQNTGITECSFYSSLSAGAYGAALGSAFSGQFWLTGGLALVGRAAELTAEAAGCNKPPPPPVTPGEGEDCWKVNGSGSLEYFEEPGTGYWQQSYQIASEITAISNIGPSSSTPGAYNWAIRYITGSGNPASFFIYGKVEVRARLTGECTGTRPPEIPTHNPGEPIADPVTHTDSQGCNWTIQATDAYVDDSGKWHTYYTITADNDACGGPFAYWSTDGSDEKPDFVTEPGNDPEGEPYPTPPPKDYQPKFDDVQIDLDDIKKELEAIKQCACGDPKPELLGDWISIRFVSELLLSS